MFHKPGELTVQREKNAREKVQWIRWRGEQNLFGKSLGDRAENEHQ